MFFLKNCVKVINPMLKNKRVFSDYNNGCNFDFETKKKLQIMARKKKKVILKIAKKIKN